MQVPPTAAHAQPARRRSLVALFGAAAAAAGLVAGAARAQQTAWTGGNGTWSDVTKWTAGVPNAPSTDALIDTPAAATVQLDGAYAVNGLTVGAADKLSVNLGYPLDVYGGATISGTVAVGYTFTNGQLYIGHVDFHGSQQVNLGGTGRITLAASPGLQNLGNAAVVIGPQLTVIGGGGISGGTAGFVNQGLVVANIPGNQLTVTGQFYNSGTVRVQNANTYLVIPDASTWHNGAGVLEVDDGAWVQILTSVRSSDIGTIHQGGTNTQVNLQLVQNAGSVFALGDNTGTLRVGQISGGTVRTTGAGRLTDLGGTLVLDNVTLDTGVDGFRFNRNGGDVELRGTVTLANGARLSTIGPSTTMTNSIRVGGTSAVTLTGTGEVFFGTNTTAGGASNYGANYLEFTSGTGGLTIGPGILIHGGNGLINGQSRGMLNQGTIAADVPGSYLHILGGMTNAGMIRVGGGATMGASLSQAGGTVQVDGLMYGSGSNGLNLQGGNLTGSGTVSGAFGTGVATVTFGGGTLAPGDDGIGRLSVSGHLTLTGGAHYVVETAGVGTSDLLAVSGNLDLGGPDDYLDLPANPAYGSAYTVATYGGTLSGIFDHVTPGYTVSYGTPGQIVAAATPEPVTLMSGLGVAALALRRPRRRERPRERP